METIYNIPQLLDLIERKNLNSKQICRILSEGFKLYCDENQDRETLIQELKDYDFKYANGIDKPLFLECDIDVDAFLKEHETGNTWLSFKEYHTNKAAVIASISNKSITASKETDTYFLTGKPILKFTTTPE